MRFIFKTDYEDDIRLLPHSGYIWTYGTLLVLLAIAPFGGAAFHDNKVWAKKAAPAAIPIP